MKRLQDNSESPLMNMPIFNDEALPTLQVGQVHICSVLKFPISHEVLTAVPKYNNYYCFNEAESMLHCNVNIKS